MRETRRIKVKTICIIKNEKEEILVSEGYDSLKNIYYYRPLGGNVDYRERTIDAVRREIKEELGEDLVNLELIQIIENIFEHEGEQKHEIMYVYKGDIKDKNFYEKTTPFYISESDGEQAKVMWVGIDDCISGKFNLVPEELMKRLREL
jgi:8-oxo-dGTP pyrophosphatase MutT (NUDIX family)